jgi:hypothetical protein
MCALEGMERAPAVRVELAAARLDSPDHLDNFSERNPCFVGC